MIAISSFKNDLMNRFQFQRESSIELLRSTYDDPSKNEFKNGYRGLEFTIRPQSEGALKYPDKESAPARGPIPRIIFPFPESESPRVLYSYICKQARSDQ